VLQLPKAEKAQEETLWLACTTKYPNFEYPYIHLAKLYAKDKKRLKEAETMDDKALAIAPQNTTALLEMWKIKTAEGDKEGAAKYLGMVAGGKLSKSLLKSMGHTSDTLDQKAGEDAAENNSK
jgi:hypothetical protein